jgi:hypothetical protein
VPKNWSNLRFRSSIREARVGHWADPTVWMACIRQYSGRLLVAVGRGGECWRIKAGKKKGPLDVQAFHGCSEFRVMVYFMAVALIGSGVEKQFQSDAICFRSYWMQGAALRGAESSASGSYRQADVALVGLSRE